ncbi:MAG: hypothetical protein JWL69_292 [Phycisphaerales bacterium]|nr:hypothetical protein [Phycisphaerales bacterium]
MAILSYLPSSILHPRICSALCILHSAFCILHSLLLPGTGIEPVSRLWKRRTMPLRQPGRDRDFRSQISDFRLSARTSTGTASLFSPRNFIHSENKKAPKPGRVSGLCGVSTQKHFTRDRRAGRYSLAARGRSYPDRRLAVGRLPVRRFRGRIGRVRKSLLFLLRHAIGRGSLIYIGYFREGQLQSMKFCMQPPSIHHYGRGRAGGAG